MTVILVVLAMGKMGAGELNYSSDIDLIALFDPAAPGPAKEILTGALTIVPVFQAFMIDHGVTFLGEPDWTLSGMTDTALRSRFPGARGGVVLDVRRAIDVYQPYQPRLRHRDG